MPLKLTIPARKILIEETMEFIDLKECTLVLEHSLLSVSKWESKWHVSFLKEKTLTDEQTIDYVRCMTITQNVDPLVYKYFPKDCLEKVIQYIGDPMTATVIYDIRDDMDETTTYGEKKKETVTSELVYYWMLVHHIPFTCEKWNFSRLITLIKICNAKNSSEKMTPQEQARYQHALNAKRKAKHH